ncbi:MAG: hypothetical protein HKN07_15570 [Acidimicrobiia bacterium]|nr:hypothetical protein [Acidimicrobiia bacterium]NNF65662.1 hypothetical protein [Acidimicrobiia bacterium]
MRRAVLFRSINRVLGTSEQVIEAAYVWSRHRLMVWYGTGAFVLLFAVAEFAGFDDLATKVALGAAGAAVAVTATTDYRIVAMTTEGAYVFRASRIRRVALSLVGTLDPDTTMSPVGGTVFAVDWQVGEARYTVTKSSEQAIQRIADERG